MARKIAKTATHVGDVMDFLASDPHAQEICGHRGTANSLADTIRVPSGTLRSAIGNNSLSPYRRDILARNFAFDASLLNARPEEFKRQYSEKYRDAVTREAAKQSVADYRKTLPPRSPNASARLKVSRPRQLPSG